MKRKGWTCKPYDSFFLLQPYEEAVQGFIVLLGGNNQDPVSTWCRLSRPMLHRIPHQSGLHNDLFSQEAAAFFAHSHSNNTSEDAVSVERFE